MTECSVISIDIRHFSSFCRRNAATGIDFKHFHAVDGAALTHMPNGVVLPGANYSMRAIGAALSHRTLWQECLSRGEVLAVFEDDAWLRHDFEAQLQTLLQRVTGWDLILFGCNMDTGIELAVTPHVNLRGSFSVAFPQSEHLVEFTKMRDAVALCRVLLAFGICGYAITPRGAEHLLRHCFPLDNRPVRLAVSRREVSAYGIDCMMADAYRKIKALLCWPQLVMTPNEHRSSQIQRHAKLF
jgi:glycosyl transferase, family 25